MWIFVSGDIMKAKEKHYRSILKSITYRILGSFVVSPIIYYYLTKSVETTITFSFVEFFGKLVLYYVFERIWSHIDIGYGEPVIDLLDYINKKKDGGDK